MYKKLIKILFISIVPLICFGQSNSYAHKKFDTKGEAHVHIKDDEQIRSNKKNMASLEDEFEKDFESYQTFENSVKPINQFINLFGVGGFADQRLKDSSFNLWDTYQEEMYKQIGIQKLNGTDINNTFNESLNSLGK